MLPLDPATLAGTLGVVVLPLLLGVAFGWVLESAGFGDSRVLAGQFYFRDLSVIRVMFTAIVVAMLLVHWASALGWLDFEQVWVNPTYFVSGIVGGLVMGVGFTLGGFCPGTSLVALATFKLDGLFFVLGGLVGMFLFGEQADSLAAFLDLGSHGRLTLGAVAGIDAGWVALAATLFAIAAFWGTNRVMEAVGREPVRVGRGARAGAGLLVVAALGLALVGQPTLAERVARLDAERLEPLRDRSVHVSPWELAHLMQDDFLPLTIVDLRSEADWNLFHLHDARRLDPRSLDGPLPAWWPTQGAILLVANDEALAEQAWLALQTKRVPNVFLLEGGVNGWLAAFAGPGDGVEPLADALPASTAGAREDGRLRWRFDAALGERNPAARPALHHGEGEDYVHKVKLTSGAKKSGGCG